MKIKKNMRIDRIAGSNLRKVIQKVILCDKNGGNKGVPTRYCYDIISDLVDFGLIEKVGMVHKDIIYEDKNKKLAEVSERLKDWKIDEKIRSDKEVKEKLSKALEVLDKDPVYRVIKSQCDKELKQAFW